MFKDTDGIMKRALRVLLIEDDEEDYLIAQDLFDGITHHRYQLDWVDNYEQGLAELRRQRHDLYLLDYHLGARDGLELLREALASGCRSPIIMLTGQGGRQVDLDAMKLGAYDYLVKGQITSAMLERAIRYAMQHARTIGALRDTVRLSSALLSVIQHLKQGVAISDPTQEDDPLIYVNDRYLDLTGYSREALLGRNARQLQGVESNPEEVARMRRALEAGESYHGELLNYRSDGSTFLNRMSIYPVHDRDGVLVQRVLICEQADV